MRFLNAVLCFLFDHEVPRYLPESEPWICTRCGTDARPTWVIQLDTEDRLERIYLKMREKQL